MDFLFSPRRLARKAWIAAGWIPLFFTGLALAQGPIPSDAATPPAQSAPPGTNEQRLPPASAPLPDELGTPPSPVENAMPEGSVADAKAMEIAGIRATSPVRFTSDPSGAQVLVNNQAACQTPCLINLPPGRYTFQLKLKDYKDVEMNNLVVSSEELSLYAKLGDKVPYEIAFPLIGVGAIFIAGGVYGMVKGYSNQDLPPEDRVWNRNLGWASLAIGVPMVAVAMWLFFSGTESKIIKSMSPTDMSMKQDQQESEPQSPP